MSRLLRQASIEVLLSTTIVESGLDIPSANTMIIHRADRFGLAQLYQLRGRVGRSKTRAYAYLTTPAEPHRSPRRREKRLQGAGRSRQRSAPASSSPATISTFAAPAICSATSNRAISRRSASNSTSRCSRRRSWTPRPAACASARSDFSPQITRRRADPDPRGLCPRSRPAHGALPPPQRARGPGRAIEAFAAEMIDRFGPLPRRDRESASSSSRSSSTPPGAASPRSTSAPRARWSPSPTDSFPDLAGLLAYVERLKGTAKLRPDSKLQSSRDWPTPDARLNGALQLSRGLARVAAAGEGAKKELEPA